MAITKKLSEDEILFGFALMDPYIFALLFWSDDLSLPTTPEQRVLLTDISPLQAWILGRKVVKTLSLERDLCWYPIMKFVEATNRLDEAMFVTPRDSHLAPVRDRVFSKINNTPFFRQLIRSMNKSGGGQGVLDWTSGWKWHFRIEGISGTDENMAGIRARVVLGDEMAYSNFSCWNSRIMTAYPDARVKYCGVPNGVRATPFYELDTIPKQSKGWSKHNYPTFINPLYQTQEAQDRLEREFGGKATQGYITQVLGLWGDEAFSSFPPGSIALNVNLPWLQKTFNEGQVEAACKDNTIFKSHVAIPLAGPDKFYAVGVDYGYSPDPTSISIAYSVDNKVWHICARITLERVKLPIQVFFLHRLCQWALWGRALKLSCDNTSLLQTLSDKNVYGHTYESIIHFADPGGSTDLTDLTGNLLLNEQNQVMRKRNKQHYTDELRLAFQTAVVGAANRYHLWLPDDGEMIDALTAMTERRTPAGYTVYECAKAAQEHMVDGLRYLQAAILSITNTKPLEDFGAYRKSLGWAGPKRSGWQAPWDQRATAASPNNTGNAPRD